MSEYGAGLSLSDEMELDKERVKHALASQLVSGENENGFLWRSASTEECRAYIYSVLDKWYYLAKQGYDACRAYERVMENNGISAMNHLYEFIEEMDKAKQEYDTYVYEHDIEEALEEASDLLEGGEDGR